MATIIIQGSYKESEKAISALKTHFDKVKEKSLCSNESGIIKVVDVYATRFGKDNFSNEEVSRALYCCSSKEKLCTLCPYVREDDCVEKVQIDGARWVSSVCLGGNHD